jgi:hypothetical protein
MYDYMGSGYVSDLQKIIIKKLLLKKYYYYYCRLYLKRVTFHSIKLIHWELHGLYLYIVKLIQVFYKAAVTTEYLGWN